MNNLKIILLIGAIFLLSLISLKADVKEANIDKELPMLLSSAHAGLEFFLTFHPCWETPGKTNALKIYVTSSVATKVTLKIEGLGVELNKMSIPNGIIEFSLTPDQGQCYRKTDREQPQPQQVYEKRAVVVSAEDPIVVYGITRFQYTSDGYLALPKKSLGKEYIVASWNDPSSDNGNQFLTSYTSIVAAYDKTYVRIVLGGEFGNYTPGKDSLVSGDSFKREMNKSDVWLIGVNGDYNDLSGTTVKANKPVAVISGSFCAYIPIQKSACDFIISQDIPMESWGKKYHVTPIIDRKNASFIKVFTSVDNTIIKRNGIEWAKIQRSGGFIDQGYMTRRASSTGITEQLGYVPPAVISSDQRISVTQYNCGQNDDGVSSDPFQMVLIPIEQYQELFIWCTPGIYNGSSFKKNFINLCYQTDNGKIPDDMEFGHVENGVTYWRKLNTVAANPGLAFEDPDLVGSDTWNSLTIKLDDPAGVYSLKGSSKFTAYGYGYDNYDSYGFPVSAVLKDLSKPDIWSPHFDYSQDCYGYSKGTTIEQPALDKNLRTNFSYVGLNKSESYNYSFIYDNANFIASVTDTVDWELELIDQNADARAVLIFSDRAGNDTTVTIEYSNPQLIVEAASNIWETKPYDAPAEAKEFTIVNKSTTAIAVDSIVLMSSDIEKNWDYNGFYIDPEIYDNGILPTTIEVDEEIAFSVIYDPSTVKDDMQSGKTNFIDSIGVKAVWSNNSNEYCYFKYSKVIKVSQEDNKKPIPEYTLACCCGDVEGTTTDAPDDYVIRSNMAGLSMDPNGSYNYSLEYEEFVVGESRTIEWELHCYDSRKDAKAVLYFNDAAGNDTSITIEYNAINMMISPEISEWTNIESESTPTFKTLTLFNESGSTVHLDSIYLLSSQLTNMNGQGFEIDPEILSQLPIVLASGNALEFKVFFDSKDVLDDIDSGIIEFADSIGVKVNYEKESNHFCYNRCLGLLKASIESSACILANGINYGKNIINLIETDTTTIENNGKTDLVITGYKYFGSFSEDIFNVIVADNYVDIEKISKTNPLLIKPGEESKVIIAFTPRDTIQYSTNIVFTSNVDKNSEYCDLYDNKIELSGLGTPVGSSVNENSNLFSVQKIIPNPIINNAIIYFTVEKTGDFKFELFDEQGKKIKDIATTYFTEGEHQISFTASGISSGIYFMRMSSGNIQTMQKIIIQ